MTTQKVTPSDAGCWIDGHWGHYGSARLIDVAIQYGWQDSDAKRIADAYWSDPTNPECEWIYEITDDAEIWLNDNIAPEGYSFGWYEGEFFLWPADEWENT